MNETPARASRPPRGIYLLPNLLTTAALFAGFYAIVAAMQGRFVEAAVAVFVAAVLDGLDGRIARLTGTQSAFGVQYDSLADMVSFGMAPALVMYAWALSGLRELGPTFGKLGWSVAFLYAACAALRLARFNTQAGVADKRYFQGLASPAAAGFLMAFVWTVEELGWAGDQVVWVAVALTVIASLLMVSRIRYLSFKALPMGERVPFVWVLLLVGLFVLIAVDPPRILLLIASCYLLSGPAMTLWGLQRARQQRGSGEGAP